jgi:hypothetical protein
MNITPRNAKRFLQAVAVAHIIGGAVFPWMVDSLLFSAYHKHLQQVFNTNDDHAAQQATFLLGIFGPTIASWAYCFYTPSTPASRDQPRRPGGLCWQPAWCGHLTTVFYRCNRTFISTLLSMRLPSPFWSYRY